MDAVDSSQQHTALPRLAHQPAGFHAPPSTAPHAAQVGTGAAVGGGWDDIPAQTSAHPRDAAPAREAKKAKKRKKQPAGSSEGGATRQGPPAAAPAQPPPPATHAGLHEHRALSNSTAAQPAATVLESGRPAAIATDPEGGGSGAASKKTKERKRKNGDAAASIPQQGAASAMAVNAGAPAKKRKKKSSLAPQAT